MITSFRSRPGKEVKVNANGFTYSGILKAITEDEVYIKGPTKTWAIPLSTIRSLTYLDDQKKAIDQSNRQASIMDLESDEPTEP